MRENLKEMRGLAVQVSEERVFWQEEIASADGQK